MIEAVGSGFSGFAETAGATPGELHGGFHVHPAAKGCPRCGKLALERSEGCWSCRACGYAKCD